MSPEFEEQLYRANLGYALRDLNKAMQSLDAAATHNVGAFIVKSRVASAVNALNYLLEA